MNKDYMATKIELDKMKSSTSDNSSSAQQKPDLGSHLFKFSSKVKAFQSASLNKLATATAGLQLNKQQNGNADNESINEEEDQSQQQPQGADSSITDKETRRLRDDMESLQTQMENYKRMLKESMEQKDHLQKERNELLIKYGEAEEQIKRLKEQSISDSNRYEQLLDSFQSENKNLIEIEKKKLFKEHDEKIKDLNETCEENQQTKWDKNEEEWNGKFDIVVSQRNRLKNKAKSLQNDLSEYLNKNDYHKNNVSSSFDHEFEKEDELKMEDTKTAQIKQLKDEMEELKKRHNNEKSSLLNSIQRLSSKSVQSKGSDMHFLVNSLSNLISEKEDIITAVTESKKYLGHRLLSIEKELNELKNSNKTK